jgi:hypothetical protein
MKLRRFRQLKWFAISVCVIPAWNIPMARSLSFWSKRGIDLRVEFFFVNRFVTAVDTARRTPDIRNNIISDQTVRNRLRQSGLRSRPSTIRCCVGCSYTNEQSVNFQSWAIKMVCYLCLCHSGLKHPNGTFPLFMTFNSNRTHLHTF